MLNFSAFSAMKQAIKGSLRFDSISSAELLGSGGTKSSGM
jgi:hypothetical protein